MGGSQYSKDSPEQPEAAPAPTFKQYRRVRITDITEARPYITGELLSSKVSISMTDKAAGSPKEGDMIARNPANHDSQWLITQADFTPSFEPLEAPAN